MYRFDKIVFTATLLIMVPGLSRAQTGDPWVGKRVITHYGAVLRVGNQVVDDADRGKNLDRGKDCSTFRVYRVEQTNGPWLWLVAEEGGTRGWVKTEWVIAFDQAADYFTNQIRANPGTALYYLRRGVVWDAKGEYDKAIADCNEAIRLDPKNAWAYSGRGVAWAHKQEYDKALADYTEAIRLDPKDPYPYNGRAWIWATCPEEKYRDGKRAVESATRGCELSGWGESDCVGTLAAAYAEAGDFAKAVEWQTKAIELLKDEKEKDDYRTQLKLYQEKKPYREAAS